MKNTEAALKWIVATLNKLQIPFQVTGGFAASAYGSKRSFSDIDIKIHDKDINRLSEEVKEYIVFGPEQYKDENWDLFLMTLQYQGQEIDIFGSTANIFNQTTEQWEVIKTDLDNSIVKEIYSMQVPVICL